MKQPSRIRQIAREVQLTLAVGTAVLISYAFAASTLALHLDLPPVGNAALRLLIAGLVAHGPMLVIAPVLCALAVRITDIHPWRLGAGVVAFSEAMLFLLRYVSGELEPDGYPWSLVALELGFAAAAAVLAGLAARRLARSVAALEAAPAVSAVAAAPTVTAAEDFAEQMRRVQEQARAAAASVDPAPAAQVPAATAAPDGTEAAPAAAPPAKTGSS